MGNLAWLNPSHRTSGMFRSWLESPWLFSKDEFAKFFQNSDQEFRGSRSWKLDIPCFILAGQFVWSADTEDTSQVPCDLVFQYLYFLCQILQIFILLIFFYWSVLHFHSRNVNEQKIKIFQGRKCSGIHKSTHYAHGRYSDSFLFFPFHLCHCCC